VLGSGRIEDVRGDGRKWTTRDGRVYCFTNSASALSRSCLDPGSMPIREELEIRLMKVPGVSRRPSRRGPGHTYFVGEQEIAHFHGDQRLDVRLTRERIRQSKSEGSFDDRVRTRGPSADWVAVQISEIPDLDLAISLVEQAVLTNAREKDRRGARARN